MKDNFLFAVWKPFELVWFAVATLTCIATSFLMHDTPVSFVAALTGILYTLLAGKGLRFCYLFGTINCICYTALSLQSHLFGEAMLYGLYYLPMMFVGFFAWKKNLDDRKIIVRTRLSNPQRLILVVTCAAVLALYATLLYFIGGRTPGLDSATNVLSAAAMYLSVKRCIEQWILWFFVNVISIVMWTLVYLSTGEASSIILMYAVFLVSGIIFYFQWRGADSLRTAEK